MPVIEINKRKKGEGIIFFLFFSKERLDYRRHLLLLSVKLCITKSRYGCRLLGVQQREKWARILSMLDSLYPPPLSVSWIFFFKSENTTTRSYNQVTPAERSKPFIYIKIFFLVVFISLLSKFLTVEFSSFLSPRPVMEILLFYLVNI